MVSIGNGYVKAERYAGFFSLFQSTFASFTNSLVGPLHLDIKNTQAQNTSPALAKFTMSGPMFLGLDASTQALKASLLTSTLDVRKELAVNFDADLPHYKTKGGVHHGPNGQVHSPVEMAIEAFDVLFGRMKEAGWPLDQISGVAAAGQVSLAPSSLEIREVQSADER